MKVLRWMAAFGAVAGSLVCWSPTATAQAVKPEMTVSYTADASSSTVRAEMRHGAGPRFGVAISHDSLGTSFVYVGVAPLNKQGAGTAVFPGPNPSSMASNELVYFRGTVFTPIGRVHTAWLPVGFNVASQRLNFNFDAGGNQLANGTKINEQWAAAGVHISADNNVAGHPDQVIIFDSANPGPTDLDLQTPGYGPNNTAPLGNLLIIAENVNDGNGDGLVDVPDDEAGGGTITFDFDRPVAVSSIALIDLDEGAIGSIIRFFDGATQIGEVDLPPAGDNSSQIVNFLFESVTKVTVSFTGSGGIPFMGILPCPFVVNFDFNTFGEKSASYVAGLVIDEEIDSLGAIPSVDNATPGHPDKLTIFNTQAPTGGDFDLQTPGFGPGNNTPQGHAMIIAENDFDGNNDELIDDPDDEAFGGVMTLTFGYDFTFESATVLDVDGNESSFILVFDEGNNLLAQFNLANLGDNSVQTVNASVANARRVELHLGGSGALTRFSGCTEFE